MPPYARTPSPRMPCAMLGTKTHQGVRTPGTPLAILPPASLLPSASCRACTHAYFMAVRSVAPLAERERVGELRGSGDRYSLRGSSFIVAPLGACAVRGAHLHAQRPPFGVASLTSATPFSAFDSSSQLRSCRCTGQGRHACPPAPEPHPPELGAFCGVGGRTRWMHPNTPSRASSAGRA